MNSIYIYKQILTDNIYKKQLSIESLKCIESAAGQVQMYKLIHDSEKQPKNLTLFEDSINLSNSCVFFYTMIISL